MNKEEGGFIENRITILIVITLLIDVFLIYILKNEKKLVEFDKAFIYLMLIAHLLFISANLSRDIHSRDQMHMLYVMATAFVSLFITNKKIITLIIIIILAMLSFWHIDGECPIGSVKNTYPQWQEFYNSNVNFFRLWPSIVILILITKLFI